jgi:Na+/H+-dicarboxylate symporter
MSETSSADSHAGSADNGGHRRLTLYIIVAIVAAILLALLFPRLAMVFDVGGQVFLRLLQMIVVPLVMASVMSGILGLGDIRKLGRPGGAALLFYLTTTLLAVFVGLIVVNTIDPGIGIDPKLVQDARREGERELDEATERLRNQMDAATWESGTATAFDRDGLSDSLQVHGDSQPYLEVTITQQGAAARPASARVLISTDGEQFEPLMWDEQEGAERFTAGADPGSYSGKLRLPHTVRAVRIDFTTQTGGQSSTITAQLLPGPPSIAQIFVDLVLMLFTDNLLRSMVEMNLLPLIVFSIVFAAMLTTMGKRSALIAELVTGVNDALMTFIMLLMKVAPLGIFCLVTARFGKAQADGKFFELLQAQFYYILTVLIGLAIHALVTLPVILYVFTRRNPYRFIGQMSQALLTAFSTASSTATLPITMECAEQEAGVSKRSAEFVLPLGATVNMDGTALYEAAAAIFIAQAISFDLSLLGQLTVALTATLAAIGAAGIPEAGLVTMLIVLNAVGLPLELIGLILPVDWLLDRFRTAVNVFGDSIGAAVVEGTFPD